MRSAMKNKKISLCLLLAVCIIVSLIAVLAVPSGAAVTVNEGASFSSSTYYQMKESIPEHTDHTLEVEFFLDPTTADNERPGVIIGNWHDETRDNNEWSVEIHKYGNIRLFHMNKENGAFEAIFFNPADVTTFAEENVGTPTDIRTHMGTAAEPKFAKMSVTVNTVSGEATLYINGKWIMTVGPNGSSYLDNNGNTVENAELKSSYVLGRTYTPSAKNPYHVIGGDCRNGSGDDFAGRIKNISLYADIRTEAEIKAYADATDFSIDSADANLCFAYDFTSPELKINEGYVKDLSANGIIAANPGWTATGRTFSTTDALMLTEGKKLTVMPRTYEAIIYAPSTITDSRVGVVFGNYHNGGTEGALNFEIRNTTDGVSMHIDPALQADGTTNQAAKNTTSGVSVRNNSAADYGWMHVVMVAREGKASESSTSSAGYYWEVYINGVSVKKVDQNTVVGLLSEYDMSSMQEKYKFMLGADHRGSANANARFKGTMRQLALYENALTAEEIYESYINGGGKGDSIILNYDMSSLESSDYVLDTTGNGYHMTQNGVSLGSLIGGMTFTSSDNLVLADKLDIQPLTYEATVYLPEDYADTDRGGVIFGNYQLGTIPCLNFEIYSNGNPRFYMHDDSSSYTRSSLVFEDCDIRQGGWVHLVLTQDNSGDTATFNCYINGELIETITDVNKANVTLDDTYTSQTNNFALGKDRRGGTPNYFKGNIKSLSLYSKTLTADEVKAAYENGGKGDILYYDLSAASASAGYVPDLTGNGYDATKDGIKPEGISFTDDSEYYLSKKLGDQPLTYEADIYLPKYLSRGGVIIGNYSGTSASGCINFEISSNGNPRLYIIDGGRTVRDVVFTNCDVRTGDWAHLAITHTKAPNLSTFNCYLNGELIETKTLKYSCAADMLTAEASSPFSLGHDSRNGEGQQFFKGRIKSVALYTKPLSEEEIKASYNNGVDSSLDSLMAYYDLTLEDNQGDTVSDGSGNGHHLSNIFNERSSSPTDYAYSFAVVGDTQMLTLYDSLNNTNYTSYIYDWLVENKDKKNIQLVMGMGDVTDKNTAAEWLIAQENVNKLNGKIPYTLIAGNHENPASLNPYFQNNANFTAFGDDIVYMEGTSLGNYYVRMNIEGNKYMVFGLEYGPNDAILSWVSEELEKEENEGYQAIITTHGYMYRNSTTISSNDVASSSVNNGLSIWNKLISKHDNIMMVLSGHDPACDIVIRQSESAGGNVVTEMLVDFQYMDRGVDYKSGMVAMLYFSADGKKVTVEYVSTYATLEAQKKNAEAGDYLAFSNNQFTFRTDKIEGEETEFGIIPTNYTDKELYPVHVFDESGRWIGAYSGWYLAVNDAFNESMDKNYNVLIRSDISEYDNIRPGAYKGTLTVDLAGNTVSFGDYMMDIYFEDNSSAALTEGVDVRGSFVIKNGTLKRVAGNLPLFCVNYGASYEDSVYTGPVHPVYFSLDFNEVTFISESGSRFIFDTWENGYDAMKSAGKDDSIKFTTDVSFTDCVFDAAASVSDTVFFALTNSDLLKDRVIYNVDIKGGELIASEAVTVWDIASINDDTNGRADTLEVRQNGSGKYIALVLPEEAEAPSAESVWVVDDGAEMSFVKTGVSEGLATYKLIPVDIATFAPKSNLTLETGFVYNIYIPETSLLTSLKINGEEIDASALPIENIGGKDYRKFTARFISYKSVADITVEATLNDGDNSYKASFVLSILSYAESILDGSYTEEEKTLAKDMLAYARATYTFFTDKVTANGNTAEEIKAIQDKIDAVIGSDYDSAYAPKSEAKAPESGSGFSSVTLYLGDTPAFRFYIDKDSSVDTSAYTFKVGGVSVIPSEGTDTNGDYLEIKVYAYQLAGDVTFGTFTYNVFDYYEKAEGDVKELVERLIKYSESAKAYRDSVISSAE